MTTETTTTNPTTTTVDPAAIAAAAAAAATVTDPPATTTPPAGETTPAASDSTTTTDPAGDKPHGNKGKTPWYLSRISEETEARQRAEREAADAKQMLERLQKGGAADPAATTTTTTQPPAAEPDIDPRALQIAEDRLKIRSVVRAGTDKFVDWDQRAETLAAAGAASPAFVLDVAEVDPANAHLILHQLADDPQKAATLARMSPRARIIELTKMSTALTQTTPPPPAADPKPAVPPKTVSKAPPPAPPVDPGASQAIDWRSDKASDEDFSKGWDARQRERAANRR